MRQQHIRHEYLYVIFIPMILISLKLPRLNTFRYDSCQRFDTIENFVSALDFLFFNIRLHKRTESIYCCFGIKAGK